MTFKQLRARAKEQGATYICELGEQTQGELLTMFQAVEDYWDIDEQSDPEEELQASKVSDLDELFKAYSELKGDKMTKKECYIVAMKNHNKNARVHIADRVSGNYEDAIAKLKWWHRINPRYSYCLYKGNWEALCEWDEYKE